MRFTKMHGAGNDYVFVNCFDERVADAPGLARAVADRNTGVGSDGLILICPSESAAVRMEMYNADGSRGRMCGNGIRCVAKYAFEHGLTRETRIPIDTDAGVKVAECTLDGGRVVKVRIDMGEPSFRPADIPVRAEGEAVIDAPVSVKGVSFSMTCVSMGNPHAVVFVEKLADAPVDLVGPALERHEMFPEKVNVHFVEVLRRDEVRMISWERGSGRTMACGTGASAVCVAGARTNRTDRRIVTEVPGGELEIEWADDDHVHKTGPAVEIFSGCWPD